MNAFLAKIMLKQFDAKIPAASGREGRVFSARSSL